MSTGIWGGADSKHLLHSEESNYMALYIIFKQNNHLPETRLYPSDAADPPTSTDKDTTETIMSKNRREMKSVSMKDIQIL